MPVKGIANLTVQLTALSLVPTQESERRDGGFGHRTELPGTNPFLRLASEFNWKLDSVE